LGVVPYLSEDAIGATLRFVAAGSPGSEVIFDYAEQHRDERHQAAFQVFVERVAKVGEPIRTQLNPENLANDLAGQGYSFVGDFSMADMERLYFRGRSDGFAPPQRGRIMQARV
jgi:O-methyltransferase involved in polyketide biosynthesis